jgi:hypothetical protein
MKSLAAHEYPNNPTIWNKCREQAVTLIIYFSLVDPGSPRPHVNTGRAEEPVTTPRMETEHIAGTCVTF